ncbi:MAG: HAD-IA family hydrolase, partial [Sharpea porci]
YLLSNLNQDRYIQRYQQEPEIFSLFDGATLSGGAHELKPDASLYLKFFQQFHLDPSDGLLIDDSLANIETAQRLSMKTILSQPQQNLIERLKTMGVDL